MIVKIWLIITLLSYIIYTRRIYTPVLQQFFSRGREMIVPINVIVILCDNCKRGFLLFDDPNVYAKEGFKAVKVLGAWRDFCSDECEREFKTTEMRG